MTQTYTKLLVTKLSEDTHEKLKRLASQDRRTLSSMSRCIIEDYMEGIQSEAKDTIKNKEK
jgi:predicted DNA-binding protein